MFKHLERIHLLQALLSGSHQSPRAPTYRGAQEETWDELKKDIMHKLGNGNNGFQREIHRLLDLLEESWQDESTTDTPTSSPRGVKAKPASPVRPSPPQPQVSDDTTGVMNEDAPSGDTTSNADIVGWSNSIDRAVLRERDALFQIYEPEIDAKNTKSNAEIMEAISEKLKDANEFTKLLAKLPPTSDGPREQQSARDATVRTRTDLSFATVESFCMEHTSEISSLHDLLSVYHRMPSLDTQRWNKETLGKYRLVFVKRTEKKSLDTTSVDPEDEEICYWNTCILYNYLTMDAPKGEEVSSPDISLLLEAPKVRTHLYHNYWLKQEYAGAGDGEDAPPGNQSSVPPSNAAPAAPAAPTAPAGATQAGGTNASAGAGASAPRASVLFSPGSGGSGGSTRRQKRRLRTPGSGESVQSAITDLEEGIRKESISALFKPWPYDGNGPHVRVWNYDVETQDSSFSKIMEELTGAQSTQTEPMDRIYTMPRSGRDRARIASAICMIILTDVFETFVYTVLRFPWADGTRHRTPFTTQQFTERAVTLTNGRGYTVPGSNIMLIMLMKSPFLSLFGIMALHIQEFGWMRRQTPFFRECVLYAALLLVQLSGVLDHHGETFWLQQYRLLPSRVFSYTDSEVYELTRMYYTLHVWVEAFVYHKVLRNWPVVEYVWSQRQAPLQSVADVRVYALRLSEATVETMNEYDTRHAIVYYDKTGTYRPPSEGIESGFSTNPAQSQTPIMANCYCYNVSHWDMIPTVREMILDVYFYTIVVHSEQSVADLEDIALQFWQHWRGHASFEQGNICLPLLNGDNLFAVLVPRIYHTHRLWRAFSGICALRVPSSSNGLTVLQWRGALAFWYDYTCTDRVLVDQSRNTFRRALVTKLATTRDNLWPSDVEHVAYMLEKPASRRRGSDSLFSWKVGTQWQREVRQNTSADNDVTPEPSMAGSSDQSIAEITAKSLFDRSLQELRDGEELTMNHHRILFGDKGLRDTQEQRDYVRTDNADWVMRPAQRTGYAPLNTVLARMYKTEWTMENSNPLPRPPAEERQGLLQQIRSIIDDWPLVLQYTQLFEGPDGVDERT